MKPGLQYGNICLRYIALFIILFILIIVSISLFNKKDVIQTIQASYLAADEIKVKIDQLIKNPLTLRQDEPKFIEIIRRKYLIPPSKLEYNLVNPTKEPSMGQAQRIREILKNQRDGFFVECGAYDGETRSNTLMMEKDLGWTGILVEADPTNYEKVIKKHRKAFTVSACLATHPYPHTVVFKQSLTTGKITEEKLGTKKDGHSEVQCLPIYSILLSANRTNVDYFSLDVEGHELDVLKTIPWDLVNIRTLSVEFRHGNEGKDVLKNYMIENGYEVHSEVIDPNGYANDFIFVKK